VEGELLYLSEGFSLLGNLSPDDVIGKKWGRLLTWTSESIAVSKTNITHCARNPDYNATFDMAYHHEDGTLHHLSIHEYSIYSAISGTHIVDGVAIDITNRKRKDEKMRILMKAIENTPSSVVITDVDGLVTYSNPAFSLITGYSTTEALGKNLRILKSGLHDEDFYQNIWETLAKGNIWQGEISNRKHDGSLLWESASISPIRDDETGKIISYVAVKEDITEKKEVENMKADVERIMHHDLKSPLNAIINFPAVIKMQGVFTDKQLKMLNIIEEAGKQMLEMIEMTLDTFKMESGRYEYNPEAVDLLNVISSLIQQHMGMIHSKKISISMEINNTPHSVFCLEDLPNQLSASNVEEPHSPSSVIVVPTTEPEISSSEKMMILTEERLLYSLMSNVLLNAIEASPDNTPIVVSIIDTINDTLSLTLTNKSAVPHSIRDCFFEKYKTHGKAKGTGLGTYSAKLLCNAMGYIIDMETSDETDSTSISITIPKDSCNL